MNAIACPVCGADGVRLMRSNRRKDELKVCATCDAARIAIRYTLLYRLKCAMEQKDDEETEHVATLSHFFDSNPY